MIHQYERSARSGSLVSVVVIFVSLFFLGLLAGIYAKAVQADEVFAFVDPQLQISFTDDKCGDKVLPLIPAEHQARFHAASVTFEGKHFAACWASLDPSNILLVDETGDGGVVPTAKLLKRGLDA